MNGPRTGLILAPLKNRPKEISDATGSFQIGATRFKKAWPGVTLAPYFDNSGDVDKVKNRGQLRQAVAAAMNAAAGPWDVLAFFGHGEANGLWSGGFSGQAGVKEFAELIRPHMAGNLTVILYACGAGAQRGFASQLAGLLGGKARVLGHPDPLTHSWRYPHVVSYPGGEPVMATGDPLWRYWFKRMDNEQEPTLFQFRFPFMSKAELELELMGLDALPGRWNIEGKASGNIIFFHDETVYLTGTEQQRNLIMDAGSWDIDHVNLAVSIKWQGTGPLDVWPLPLDMKHQSVRDGAKGGPVRYRATRIEDDNVNPKGHFARVP